MKSKIKLEGDIIGLDLGMARTGAARMNTYAQISEPLDPIDMRGDLIRSVEGMCTQLSACALVIGIPRGLDGQDTQQTVWAKEQVAAITAAVGLPVFEIDEAGTTKEAEKIARKNDSVDSVAACILLEDFRNEVISGRIENVVF